MVTIRAGRWRAAVLAMVAASTSLVLATGAAPPAGAQEAPVFETLCDLRGFTPLVQAQDTARGPDGNVWVTTVATGIARVEPSGVMTFFGKGFPAAGFAANITAGPDNAMWFTLPLPSEPGGAAEIGRITMDGTITIVGDIAPHVPSDITTGPDGNLWFTTTNSNVIVRMTPAGETTDFPVGASTLRPAAITAGPDGNLWITSLDGIGRVSTAGAFTLFDQGLSEGSSPVDIVAGSDGNLWFADGNARVGKVTTAGAITEFDVPLPADWPEFRGRLTGLTDIALAPDGSLWFTEFFTGRMGRITTGGSISFVAELTSRYVFFGLEEFDFPFSSFPHGLSFGADGNAHVIAVGAPASGGGQVIMRVSAAGAVSRIQSSAIDSAMVDPVVTPDGRMWSLGLLQGMVSAVAPNGVGEGYLVRSFDDPSTLSTQAGMALGADGNFWITEPDGGRIVRLTPQGGITRFGTGITTGAKPTGIAAGPDGNLWFTEPGVDRIGRITTAGIVTEFSQGITAEPFHITAGRDGNLWFTVGPSGGPNRIARITPAGVVTEFPLGLDTGGSAITDITGGPDGNLWFTLLTGDETAGTLRARIGRLTPAGVVTYFEEGSPGAVTVPTNITPIGDDLWFTVVGLEPVSSLNRITTDGVITRFDVTPPDAADLPYPVFGVQNVVGGPDGSIWLTRPGFPSVTRAMLPDDVGDRCNPDEDGDTHRDVVDAFPFDPTEWADPDGDLVGSNRDNCPTIANANQLDGDRDGIGDRCDRSVTLEVPNRAAGRPTARLLDAAGAPIANATIVFTARFRERSCSSVTDSQGRASCEFGRFYDYEAVFAGDALHDPGTARTWSTRR